MRMREAFQFEENQKRLKLPHTHMEKVRSIELGESLHVIYWGTGPGGHAFLVCPCISSVEFGGQCTSDQDCLTSLQDYSERRRAYRQQQRRDLDLETSHFKIYVDQVPLPDVKFFSKNLAWHKSVELHRESPGSYHEVYRVLKDGRTWGVAQLKPGDCADCGCPAEECQCLSPKPFSEEWWFRKDVKSLLRMAVKSTKKEGN